VEISKLEVAGFKSFGNKNSLQFNPGITAVVGPNGSGKSNIADAIRWVLGEQKLSKLRVSKSEDVIFHGTKNSHQSSMAHVSIVLKDDRKNSEVVISRKLYRSGESELRLNGKKVKYSTIEELLAKNGFGTRTYTVVAQGMIDNILTSTGQERKLLFDEASGIRQYDIKRAEAYRNLKSAISNLDNINSIISELSPAVAILKKQSDSQMELSKIKKDLLAAQESYLNNTYISFIDTKNIITKELNDKSKDLVEITKKIQDYKTNSQGSIAKNKSISNQTDKLNYLEKKREDLTNKLYEAKNELDQLVNAKQSIQPELDNKKTIEKDLEKLKSQHVLISSELSTRDVDIKKMQKLIDDLTSSLSGLNKDLDLLQMQISKSQKKEYILHAISLTREARVQLRQAKSRKIIDETILKISKILELAGLDDATEMALEFSKLQNTISRTMSRREEIIEKQTKDIIRLRSLELDISANQNSQKDIKNVLNGINTQLKNLSDIDKKIELAKNRIDTIHRESESVNNKIEELRDLLYSTNKDQDTLTVQVKEIEKLTSEKARLEFSIEQLKKDLKFNSENLLELDRKAKHWRVDNYTINKRSDNKIATINQIDDLIIKLRTIEEIDPEIVREAKESTERIEFLKTQQLDLQNAIRDTQKLIESLQKDIKKQFEESFKKINISFDKYFNTLFKGGSASLELESVEEDYGIEIKVSPPGKRSKNINTLSGGEKALAAIALLSAIIINNPSPFIVLDEVDAALDDENSMQFTKVLNELSGHCQVILITHNQETMQTAKNLFGITNSKNGITEILSLQLNEAKEHATA
jgi:chromosome segregation protein